MIVLILSTLPALTNKINAGPVKPGVAALLFTIRTAGTRKD